MHHPPHILLVDDDDDIRSYLVDALQANGYHTREADAGETAFQTIYQDLPDLLLLDVNLPDVLGFDLSKRLRADPVTTLLPIIFYDRRIFHRTGQRAGSWSR